MVLYYKYLPNHCKAVTGSALCNVMLGVVLRTLVAQTCYRLFNRSAYITSTYLTIAKRLLGARFAM